MCAERIELPEPGESEGMALDEAIRERRSRREFASRPLTRRQLARLLWVAQGITGPSGRMRAAPSAGATFPLEAFIAAGEDGVEGLKAGIYRYEPATHGLERVAEGDIRTDVAAAALGQDFVAAAPVDILLAALYRRTTLQYGDRGRRYVLMEAGHASQNIYLEAESQGLSTVAVGAFRDGPMSRAFSLPEELEPLYLMPVGHRR